MDSKITKVSVVTTTWGQEQFIEETLDGVFMQQYDGPIEFIIANDHSPDRTDEIIKSYLETNSIPDNFEIKYTYHEKNLGSTQNFIWAIQQATGEYVAICEGDDYWTDPLKLQKQVDFLDENPDFGSCFHQYKIYFEFENKFSEDIQPKLNSIDPVFNGMVLNSESYFQGWYTQILTSVFRKELIDNHDPKDFEFYRDNHLTYYLLKNSKSICFNMVAAVYRKHSNGVYSGISFKQNYVMHYFIYEELLLKTDDKRFYMLCHNMLIALTKKFQLHELMDLYKKIRIYSLKRKIFFSYNKEQKKAIFFELSLKEKFFIIREYIKNYAKHLHPHRQLQ